MTEKTHRVEHDSMGPVTLPASALWGPQTQRAINNFTISPHPLPWDFIKAVVEIKVVAAIVNVELGLLPADAGQAIVQAAEQLLTEELRHQFPISVYQTGSGTSTNMNVNEVIVGLALGNGQALSANDHVNLGQSSNDVIPTAIHLSSTLAVSNTLIPALTALATAIRRRAIENQTVIKTGRTHLMDALPIRLQAEFEAWATQLDEAAERLRSIQPRLNRLALGGTAIGSGINCHPDFAAKTTALLSKRTGHPFTSAPSLYKAISSLDTIVELSGHLKATAVTLLKIANDLRWMNSGPHAGLGEITLPPLQPGSSIMPAKVNPVIPEAVCMAASQVIGYDTAITLGGIGGNFQLNTMMPLVAANILESIRLLSACCSSLNNQAIAGLMVNQAACSAPLTRNPVLVTALTPLIGYLRAAEIAQIAVQEDRPLLDVAIEQTDIDKQTLIRLLDPKRLADGPDRASPASDHKAK